jgi:hypothetical protein
MAAVRTMFPLAAAIANTSRRPRYFKTTTFLKLILSQSHYTLKPEDSTRLDTQHSACSTGNYFLLPNQNVHLRNQKTTH